ncbi:hypothetical protein CPB86DRAFT_780437, partial [Serendipita vermifera]
SGIFDRIPVDVLTVILEHLDTSPLEVQLHRVSQLHSLVAFSSVNQHIRSCAEPLLFNRIVFGKQWENRGEGRWAIAEERMETMVQKESLGQFTRTLWFECSYPPPAMLNKQRRSNFWPRLARLLVHLFNLHSVTLVIPMALRRDTLTPFSQPLDLGPPLLLNNTSEIISKKKYKPHISFSWLKSLVKGCNSGYGLSVEGEPLTEYTQMEIPLSMPSSDIKFPNIEELAVSPSCGWVLSHCPNLKAFHAVNISGDTENILGYRKIYSSFPGIRRATFTEWAHASTLNDINNSFLNLEYLVLYPPLITAICIGYTDTVFMALDMEAFQESLLVLKTFSNLQTLVLRDPPGGQVFHEPDEDIVRIIQLMGNDCTCLCRLQLGSFLYRRENGWRPESVDIHTTVESTIETTPHLI